MYIYRHRDNHDPSFYFDDFIAPLRLEDLQVRQRKGNGRRVVERTHKKMTNVFRDWKPDVETTLD